MGLFLIVAGLTGSVLALRPQLQPLLAPGRFAIAAPPTAQSLDWLALHAIAEQRSGGVIDVLPLHREAGEAVFFSPAARPGQPALGFDEIVLDPYDGHEVGRSTYGRLADGPAQIIPFLYRLHYSLALSDWGTWTVGIAALIWTVDCFIGFYLTLPIARRRWWPHWGQAWRVRVPPSSGFRLSFDLHRAGGLWLWPILLIFAWSAVGFNLRPVYDPVMHALTGMSVARPLGLPAATRPPRLAWEAALASAREGAKAAMAARGISIERERELRFNRADNSYSYAIRTSRDRSDDGANSWFTINGDTGQLLRVELPTGQNSGNSIDYWFGLLHEARVFGPLYRVAVSIIGLTVASLSVTGLLIWWRKRRARIAHRRRIAATTSS
jgi:uncharacterized iron-regulated membrane protein